MCLDNGFDEEVLPASLQDFDVIAHIRLGRKEAKALEVEAGFEGRSFVVERAHA
jgi:hypothetical protein